MERNSMECNEYVTVVLANGEYPSHPVPLGILYKAQKVVCCDGAAEKYISEGHIPSVIIGDGDSLSEELREKYRELVHRISEQEDNDLTKSVKYLAEGGVKEIAIVGASGRREDHLLGNVSLLMEYMRMGLRVRMYTDYGVFVPCRGDSEWESYEGQQVSIINFSAKGLTAEGLKYPVYDFSNWWQGTLNEATGDRFEIRGEGEYLLFLNY